MSDQSAITEVRGTATARGGGAAEVGLEQLVADYHAALYRYAYRLSSSTDDAEDLTQQVFLVAAQKLDQLRRAECVRSWLYAVLRNCYLHERRRIGQQSAISLPIDMEELPDRVREDDIDREQLQHAIDELSDDYKLVVLMFYFEDCTYREIAERLELPIGTVMSRLARGKEHLRRRLIARMGREPLTTTSKQHTRKRPIPWTT